MKLITAKYNTSPFFFETMRIEKLKVIGLKNAERLQKTIHPREWVEKWTIPLDDLLINNFLISWKLEELTQVDFFLFFQFFNFIKILAHR